MEPRGSRGVIFCAATVVGLVAPALPGAVLEVGNGRDFTTIQAAWDAAGSGDTIHVYPGVYGDGSGVVLQNRSQESDPGRNNITIRATGEGRTVIRGTVSFLGTTDGQEGGHTFEGFYVDSADRFVGLQARSDPGQTLLGITVRHNVFYSSDRSTQAIYAAREAGVHGEHVYENNTIFDPDPDDDLGLVYGFRNLNNRTPPPNIVITKPVFRNNIVVGTNLQGFKPYAGGQRFDYSNHWNNDGSEGLTGQNFGSTSFLGEGNVSVDPVFASIDPASPHFLYLSPDSPLAIRTGASDGGYMGALPAVPEPASVAAWITLSSLLARRWDGRVATRPGLHS